MPGLIERLERHPNVQIVAATGNLPLVFHQSGWRREIHIDRPEIDPSGLIELMDNNPLVCADRASVPGPAATLALIAFGPLIRANLLQEDPSLVVNFEAGEDQEEIAARFLSGAGWDGGLDLSVDLGGKGPVYASVGIAAIRTPASDSLIDELYEEAYGRSFYVRRVEEGNCDANLVAGKSHAAIRLRLTHGDEVSLLTVLSMADPIGKCGAAQIVHMMNVMAGFEESLGID